MRFRIDDAPRGVACREQTNRERTNAAVTHNGGDLACGRRAENITARKEGEPVHRSLSYFSVAQPQPGDSLEHPQPASPVALRELQNRGALKVGQCLLLHVRG